MGGGTSIQGQTEWTYEFLSERYCRLGRFPPLKDLSGSIDQLEWYRGVNPSSLNEMKDFLFYKGG